MNNLISVQISRFWLCEVDDYHEFRSIVDALKDAGIKAKYTELPIDYGYYAVFYIGNLDLEVKKFIINKTKELKRDE